MQTDELAAALREHIRYLEVLATYLEGDAEGPISVEQAEDLVRARERYAAATRPKGEPSFLNNAREAGIWLLEADFERDHLSWGKRRHFEEQRQATKRAVSKAQERKRAGE